MYKATALVKTKGHRVRMIPNVNSRAIHLVMPTQVLLVASVKSMDSEGGGTTLWGKVHAQMFPDDFDACNVFSDGWCLLEETEALVYWTLADKA